MFYNDDGSVLLRKDTKANWTSVNPVLEDGELVIEVDGTTRKLKCGDGVTKYTSLPYISVGGEVDYAANAGHADSADNAGMADTTKGFTFTNVPQNADMNNYNQNGLYYNGANAQVQTMQNTPSKSAFFMLVFMAGGRPSQVWFDYDGAGLYMRYYQDWDPKGWGVWKRLGEGINV